MRARCQGWLLWLAIAFGLFNLGLPHEHLRAVQTGIDAGRWPGVLDAIRAYVTNDGDIRRYFAYAEAAVGRPYQSYFVRSAGEWRRAFAAREPFQPDALPTIAPTGPLVPYRDFLVEYPPGFFLVSLPPVWLTGGQGGYLLLFQTVMAAALTGALVLMVLALRRIGQPIALGSAMSWGALGALVLGVVATHRYDAAVALAIAVATWALAERRPAVLGLALGVAIALKGTPLLVVPVFLMHAARERRFRDLGIAIAAGAAAMMIVCLPAALTAGTRLFETFRYHADRPVQIESTWAAILGLINAAVPGLVVVEKTFGSTNLVGRLTPAVGALSNLTTLAGLCGVYLATWHRLAAPLASQRALAALEATAAALAVFIALGKVCSPQYFVWLLPFGLVLCLAPGRRACLALFLVILALTQAIYPVSYGLLESLRPGACLLVLTRNLLLLTWAALLLRGPRVAPQPKRIAGGFSGRRLPT